MVGRRRVGKDPREHRGEAAPPIRVAVSMGDPSGVGAEVTARALAAHPGAIVPYVYGDPRLFAEAARGARVSRALARALPIVEPGTPLPPQGALVAVTHLPHVATRPGKPTAAGGAAQLAYLEAAFHAVARGEADALCTAPVSKEGVASALPGFVGHTEWLTAHTGAKRSVMMLAGSRLRVALVTNHLALRSVPRALTPARILETMRIVDRALRVEFGIASPRLALCALNPHAGEGGTFGDEEARLVRPALSAARRLRIAASGPWPADSVHFRAAAGEFDAVVALYHDQGLIAVKLLDAVLHDPAVNVTLGLPIVRTSPDHGVAYDIAGKSRASAESMWAALALAARLADGRRRAAAREAAPARPSRSSRPAPPAAARPAHSGAQLI